MGGPPLKLGHSDSLVQEFGIETDNLVGLYMFCNLGHREVGVGGECYMWTEEARKQI